MSMRPDSNNSDDVAVGDLSLDLSLIDALLALTPQQRLLQNDRMLQSSIFQDPVMASPPRRAHDPTVPAGGERR